jgi:hypothetical protein
MTPIRVTWCWPLPSAAMVQISAWWPSGVKRRQTMRLPSGLKNGPPS